MDKEAYKAETTAQLEANASRKPMLVNIPGVGEKYIRRITIGELDEQINDTEGEKPTKLGLARGACRVLAYPDGERMYDPDNAADVALWAKQPFDVLTAINKAQELEGAAKKE